jgi:hypothetical protein
MLDAAFSWLFSFLGDSKGLFHNFIAAINNFIAAMNKYSFKVTLPQVIVFFIAFTLEYSLYRVYRIRKSRGRIFKITNATYGTPEINIDITKALNDSIDGNRLKVVLSNGLAGKDPVPNVVKEGHITYSIGNKVAEKTYIENDVIDLP